MKTRSLRPLFGVIVLWQLWFFSFSRHLIRLGINPISRIINSSCPTISSFFLKLPAFSALLQRRAEFFQVLIQYQILVVFMICLFSLEPLLLPRKWFRSLIWLWALQVSDRMKSGCWWFEFSWESSIEDYHFGLKLLCLFYFARLLLCLLNLRARFRVTSCPVVTYAILTHSLAQPLCFDFLELFDSWWTCSTCSRASQSSTGELPWINRQR